MILGIASNSMVMILRPNSVHCEPKVSLFVFRKAVEESRDPELQGITVYVAQDCTGKWVILAVFLTNLTFLCDAKKIRV